MDDRGNANCEDVHVNMVRSAKDKTESSDGWKDLWL